MSAADEAGNRATTVRVQSVLREHFLDVCAESERSIVEGSELTGAPGQPVDEGTLKASWQIAFPDEDTATIGTNVVYAEPIEDGVGKYGPLTLRSQVGGWHSVKLTVAGFSRIVDAVTRRHSLGG